MPRVVNGAFSIEIGLKAILINQNITYEREHNLVVLFNLLPENIQKVIWDWVSEKAPEYADEEKRNMEFVLLSDAFKQWRYAYEGAVPAIEGRFLSALANAVIGIMFSLGYNVKYVRATTDKTEEEIDQMIEENRNQFIAKNSIYISNKIDS